MKIRGRVFVIDDEKNILFVLQNILEQAGFEVVVFHNSVEALESIHTEMATEEIDVILTDLYMPEKGGMEILTTCQKLHPQLPIVIMTAYGTVEAAVHALKKGAFDFITKPFNQTEILAIIQKAVATHWQYQKEPILLTAPSAHSTSTSIIGSSAPIQEVFKIITKIAQSPSTVLLRGESGTGKELVAFEIHRQSQRSTKPFIKINCAAIPPTLIESELFGYEKGAFTGAMTSKLGRFELAHEGSLFLDEVAEMPLEMQVKLLRVLQEQEFQRVGGINTISVDVRIIAATNKDLELEVKAGRFREDLFYRLNVVPLYLPPLRERREDIDLLVPYFIHQLNSRLNKKLTGITTDSLNILKAHPWPGNIRQLENILERMMLMSEGQVLSVEDLPEEFSNPLRERFATLEGSHKTFKQIIRRQTQALERELIEKALEETSGNVTRSAEKLGLSRKGLQLKMKELGLKRQLDA